MLLAIFFSRASSSTGQLLAREDHDRHIVQLGLHRGSFQQLEARHVRQAQVQHDAVVVAVHQLLRGLGAGGHRLQLDVVMSQQGHDRFALDVVVLDDQQPLRARRR